MHRLLQSNKHEYTAHTDTHCQLIQRGDQSEAPVQHTLRGRVVKQSTVCIICSASHFSFFFMHLCFTSARLSITRRLPRWMEGRQGIFSLQRRPSHRRTPALTYLDQSVIHLSQHFTKVGAADLSDIIKAAYTLHLNPERESIMKVVKQLNYDLMCWLVVCCIGINELMWDGAKMNERLKR